MQLNLGTKIRELRRRDGRTQDDLAEALGVTPQAVSRWESGGSYPDMEMIPAVANYFHISIDELFGYHDAREEKIRTILASASEIMLKQGHSMHRGCLSKDFSEVVDMLRNASEEFPNEPKILLTLARALWMWGWSEYGAQVKTNATSGAIEDDTEYNAKNTYWQEAVRTYERMLRSEPSAEDREAAIHQLTSLYRSMGEYEKAKILANKQNSLTACKELLLPLATAGEEKERCQAERLTALMESLHFAITESIALHPSVQASGYGKQLLLSFINLYETLFIDGRFGKCHGELGNLYLLLTSYEINNDGSTEKALEYFAKAFSHYKGSARIYNEGGYSYSAPLFSALKPLEKGEFAPVDMGAFWKEKLKMLPESFVCEIGKDPKYLECFECFE